MPQPFCKCAHVRGHAYLEPTTCLQAHVCTCAACLGGGVCMLLQRASCKKKSVSFCGGSSGAEGYEKALKLLFWARKGAQAHSACEQSLMPLGHVACPMHAVPNFQGKHNRSKELWLPQTDSVCLDQLYATRVCCVLYGSDLLYSGCAATPR